MKPTDRYGVDWSELPDIERCPNCGQPDNCGDCTCHPLPQDQIALMKSHPATTTNN